MIDSPRRGRRLGPTEAICTEWYTATPAGLQVVGAVTLSRRIELDELRAAASAARDRHDVLSMGIALVEGDWHFRPPVLADADVRSAPRGSAWRARFDLAIAEQLDLERSTWFVELIDAPIDDDAASVVIVAGCHAVLDGIAMVELLRDLVAPDPDAPRRDVMPSMERLLPDPTPESAELAPGTMQPSDQWPVEATAAAASRTFGFSARRIEAPTVRALHDRARSEGASLAAVLVVACTIACDALADHSDVVGFNMPFDVRPRVAPPLPNDTIGAYFGRAHLYASRTSTASDPWTEARRIGAALHDEIDAATGNEAVDTAAVRAQVAELARPDRSTFDLDVLLTDLGRVDLGPDATGVWFTTSQTTGLEAFVVSAASVATLDGSDGAIDLGIGWPWPLVSDSTAEDFTGSLVTAIEDLARGTDG